MLYEVITHQKQQKLFAVFGKDRIQCRLLKTCNNIGGSVKGFDKHRGPVCILVLCNCKLTARAGVEERPRLMWFRIKNKEDVEIFGEALKVSRADATGHLNMGDDVRCSRFEKVLVGFDVDTLLKKPVGDQGFVGPWKISYNFV